MNKKGKIAVAAALTGVIAITTGLALGFSYGGGTYVAPPIVMLSSTETVWRTPGPKKISPADLGAPTELSTREATVKSLDVIDPTNEYAIPEDTARTVIGTEATTLNKLYESNNNNLYVYFVIETEGTTLRNTSGTFPATFNTDSMTSEVELVQNMPISVRVAWSYQTKDTYDTLANYTASFKYSYFFQNDPEEKLDTKVLTLKIEDFMIKNGDTQVTLKDSVRVSSTHKKDIFFFEPSSVIQTGF